MGNIKGVSKVLPNGSEWPQHNGDMLKIVSFQSGSNFTVKFKDSPEFQAQIKEIKAGGVFNRNRKELFGTGYMGYGKHKTGNFCCIRPTSVYII